MLGRITQLAREHDRVAQAGPGGFDGTDGTPQDDWRATLDALTATREATEALAQSAGIPQTVIDGARTTPAGTATDTGVGTAEAAGTVPELSGRDLYHDLLLPESWQLERMVAVHVVRAERVRAGVYGFGADPVTAAEVRRALTVAHTRVTALANAAELTTGAAEVLWHGPDAARARHASMAAISGWDDLELEHTWRSHARLAAASPVPALLTDEAAARTTAAQPPTLDEFLTRAGLALHSDPAPTPPHPPAAAAIDALFPGTDPSAWQPGTDPDTSATSPEPHRDLGQDP